MSPRRMARAGWRRQRGLTLVELMVSVLIGSVVVGALLVTYLSSTLTARRQQALSQMADNAQLALALLRREIQLAGSVEPVGMVGSSFTAAQPPRAVFGCETGFAARTAAAGTGACDAAGTPALELTYLATTGTASGNSSGNLVNCTGSTVVAGAFISSRWFVQTGPGGFNELYCAAPGSNSQPIVENVQVLHLRYGVADGWQAAVAQSRRPARYLAGSQLSPADWASVMAIRVCVLMRSPQPVLTGEDSADYINCDGTIQRSTDRHLYRSFATTVGIRNRGPY